MQRASVLLICLIVLCSGCAAKVESDASAPEPAPVVMKVQRCARPTAPTLPKVRGDIPFDHPAQVEVILTRDTRQRVYADGLNSALDCYDAQAEGGLQHN